MSADPQIVLCTVPDTATAERIAEAVVSAHHGACVNIIPGITSVYRWKGTIEKDQEALLVIKTSEAVYSALEQQIRSLHPYELPEIIAVRITGGSSEYLDWLTESIDKKQ